MSGKVKYVNIFRLASFVKRELIKSRSPFVLDNRFYILRSLKGAVAALRAEGYSSPTLCKRLYRYYKASDKPVTEDAAVRFLKKHGCGEKEIRLFHALSVIAVSIMLCDGDDAVYLLRSLDGLDHDQVLFRTSPLHQRLMLCDIYRKSDKRTQSEIRRKFESVRKTVKDADIREAMASADIGRILMPVSVFILALAVFSALTALGSPLPLSLLALFPSVTLAGKVVSLILSPFIKRKPLPRLERLPDGVKCAVASACLLDGDFANRVKRLEEVYLSNRIKGLEMILLADLSDSDEPITKEDEALLSECQKEIDRLDQKYNGHFHLFYRKKRFSVTEGRFIAPERKRGAVCELVKELFCGDSELEASGEKRVRAEHLIILDSDTEIYPGHLEKLLKCALHPLNSPAVKDGRVVSGYGILQPRMETTLEAKGKTPFSRFTAGEGGTELYSAASHGVYDALCKKGSFCGKGYINVSAFYQTAADAFPKDRILSHDIAEGELLRVGLASDTVFFEGHPSRPRQFFKRKHRWIRGDTQSLILCLPRLCKRKNPMPLSGRLKLFYTFISDMSSVFASLLLFFSLFYPEFTFILTLLAFSDKLLPLLVAAVRKIFSPSPGRVFFSRSSPYFRTLFVKTLIDISFTFHDALNALSAALLASVRLITKKKLLNWSVSSREEARSDGRDLTLYFLPSLFFGLFVFISSVSVLASLIGLLIAFSPALAFSLSVPYRGEERSLDACELIEYSRDMFRYFSDGVNAENSYLPPDNYQELSDIGYAHRTSPTNIGLYLISVIAAADMKIIPPSLIYQRLEKTLTTLLRLPKHEGLLYNWYDTRTATPLSGFVSTVDLGNYLACLITLKESLKEYSKEDERLTELLPAVDTLIGECDLSSLYDEKKRLFFIGKGGDGTAHYDLYESEMRLTEYTAVALGKAPAEHLSLLSVPIFEKRGHIGVYSWYATAFEYFMPALLLPDIKGSLSFESLRTAYRVQRANGARLEGCAVFGTSESCYFSFDAEGNYQYKAHGAPELALSRESDKERVISPYSLFLMLKVSDEPRGVLKRLKERGIYGRYGFYEAVDLTPSRVGGGFAVIRCYMAHHIGMSMISAANRLYGDIFVKRFFRDERIAASRLLLELKIPTDAKKYVRSKIDPPPISLRPEANDTPRDAAVVSNSVCRAVCTRAGFSLYAGDICIAENSKRKLYRPTLIYRGGKLRDLFSFPRSFSDAFSEYSSEGATARLTVASDEKAFILNVTGAYGGAAFTFAPILFSKKEYSSHIAYCKLFLVSEYKDGILYIKRRMKDGGMTVLAVACADGERLLPFRYCSRAYDMQDLNFSTAFDLSSSSKDGALGEPLVCIRCDAEDMNIILAVADSEEKARECVIRLTGQSFDTLVLQMQKFTDTVISPVRVNGGVMADIVKCLAEKQYKETSLASGSFSPDIFYRHGISGDLPIIVIDASGDRAAKQLCTVMPEYAEIIKALLIKGMRFDTAILYSEADEYKRSSEREVLRCLDAVGLGGLMGQKGGVHTVCADAAEREVFCDRAVFLVSALTKEKTTPPDPVRAPARGFEAYRDVDRATLDGDGITIQRGKGGISQSFIYAGEDFGTLVTDRSLGFTYYKNSRMWQLTRHDTDTALFSEILTMRKDSGSVDLCHSAKSVRFTLSYAEYKGECDAGQYTVRVCIDPDNDCKVIEVTADFGGVLEYSLDTALGDGSDKPLYSRYRDGSLFVFSAEKEPLCAMYIYSKDATDAGFDGRYAKMSVDMGGGGKTVFLLGAAKDTVTPDEAKANYLSAEERYGNKINAYLSPFSLRTSDPAFDTMFNQMAPYQALVSRMYARLGYSQIGGAYGFRDQLQDCLCIVYGDAPTVREHIIRCCEHQYPEGDVMHWFFTEPETGIRTKCSDDMLWLIHAVYEYVKAEDSSDILFELTPFALSSPLLPDENERYERHVRSEEKDTVYGHCKRAALYSLRFGEHGLALMGAGDWNDGMNRAGIEGKGESVWLSMFLYDSLKKMAYLAERAGFLGDKEMFLSEAEFVYGRVEEHGFVSDRYIRGYLDDGSAFGSEECREGKIDILPQAFAAIAGFDRERAKKGLETAYKRLYDEEHRIFKLFDPPYVNDTRIGCISAYPEGIRENGGQYTHGALFGAIGYLCIGENLKGYEILRSLCPLCRSRDAVSREAFRRESYVMCADVYTNGALYGTGGWSWYTGSAAWFFYATLKYLLGYGEEEGGFTLRPALSGAFERFSFTVQRHGTVYRIEVSRAQADETVLDGRITERKVFPFDRGSHSLILKLRK